MDREGAAPNGEGVQGRGPTELAEEREHGRQKELRGCA